jgi:hypothetical protein
MQNKLTVPNGSGLNVRLGFNEAIQSLASLFSGPIDPATQDPSNAFPFMLWINTSTNKLMQRNANNDAWVEIGVINAEGVLIFNEALYAMYSDEAVIAQSALLANNANALGGNPAIAFALLADVYTKSEVYSKTESGNLYAPKAGNSGQTFSVAAATLAAHAVRYGQFVQSKVGNGYQILPGGVMFQWGTGTSTLDSPQTFTFPETFPLYCRGVIVNRKVGGANYPLTAVSYTSSSFIIERHGGLDGDQPFNYFAIGH